MSNKRTFFRNAGFLVGVLFLISLVIFSSTILPPLLSHSEGKPVSFKVKRISLKGAQGWDTSALEGLLKKYLGKTIFWVNSYRVEKEIKESVSWVSSVEVKKIYPDEIRVEIKPATPCAIVVDSQRFYLVDCQGKKLGLWKESLGIYPILSNIKGNLTELLLFLKEAKQEGIYDLVSDMRLEGEEGDTVLLTVKGGVRFRFSRYDDPRVVAKKIKSVLYIAAKRGEKIAFVDLTGENARVRLKQ